VQPFVAALLVAGLARFGREPRHIIGEVTLRGIAGHRKELTRSAELSLYQGLASGQAWLATSAPSWR
jgi:hypothetical protein